MQPLITVGIASYNYALQIVKALEAVQRQNFHDYEVLISDDCSTDDSVARIKEFISSHPQMTIRLIESERNEGLVANKNKIIQNCRGEYLMLCDADDWMADCCLEKIADKIRRGGVKPDRVMVEVAHIDEQGKIIQVEHLLKSQTKWGWNILHGSVFRVSVIREYGIKINREFDDVYFTIEFAKYAKKISMIHETLYYWMVHWDSAGRKGIEEEKVHRYCAEMLHYVGNVIKYVEVRNDSDVQQDREELRFVLLKLYYFMPLFYFQPYCLKDKLKHYKEIYHIICGIDEHYLENEYLSVCRQYPLRPYAVKAIRLCARLERMHLMTLALIGYHVLTKFKRFDQ